MGLIDYCLNSTLHGLHYVVDKRLHWSERVFWAVCVVASWVACLKLQALTAANYSSNIISFTVDTNYPKWVTPFPSIIHCLSVNSFSAAQKERLFPGNRGNKHSIIENTVFFQGNLKTSVDCTRNPEQCAWGNLSEYYEELSLSCEQIFSSCEYNGRKFYCCKYFLPVTTYQGKCYAFNNYLTNRINPSAGVAFNITYGMGAGVGNLSVEVAETNLFLIALSQEEIPSPINTKYALLTSEGTTMGLDDNTIYTVYLDTKSVVCDPEVEDVDISQRRCKFGDEVETNRTTYYSKTVCDIEYMMDLQKKVCGCVAHTMLIGAQGYECDVGGLKCISVNINLLKEMMKPCPCLSNCVTSAIGFVGSTKKKMQRSFRNPNSKTRIDFIVPAPTMRYQRKVGKTSLDSLVAVGGAVALCVGASFLSIVELLYYLLIRPAGDECSSNRWKQMLGNTKEY